MISFIILSLQKIGSKQEMNHMKYIMLVSF